MELVNVSKSYKDLSVLKNFNADFEEGKVSVILGESGSGKTTILNIIAGLTSFDGEIKGKPDKISYVFQNDRLIPNLTVYENLKLIFPLENVNDALKRIDLFEFKDYYPKDLSAGMARKLSVLRAFLYKSDILLMDEPFRNLDIALKYRLMDYFKEFNADNKRTVVLVTHDIKEAVYLGDRIFLLSNGKVVFKEENVSEKTEKILLD